LRMCFLAKNSAQQAGPSDSFPVRDDRAGYGAGKLTGTVAAPR
jgi:hypothetical protein